MVSTGRQQTVAAVAEIKTALPLPRFLHRPDWQTVQSPSTQTCCPIEHVVSCRFLFEPSPILVSVQRNEVPSCTAVVL